MFFIGIDNLLAQVFELWDFCLDVSVFIVFGISHPMWHWIDRMTEYDFTPALCVVSIDGCLACLNVKVVQEP